MRLYPRLYGIKQSTVIVHTMVRLLLSLASPSTFALFTAVSFAAIQYGNWSTAPLPAGIFDLPSFCNY